MATITPEQAACAVKRAGGSQQEAAQLLSVIPGESGWNDSIVNSIGATGLWQIYPAEPGADNYLTAAPIALRKLRTQGLGAWEGGVTGDFSAQVAQVYSANTADCASLAGTQGPSPGGGILGLGDLQNALGGIGAKAAAIERSASNQLMAAGLIGLGALVLAIGAWLVGGQTEVGRKIEHDLVKGAETGAEIAVAVPK